MELHADGEIVRPRVDFPQPDSPTTPSVFPFGILKVHIVHRMEKSRWCVEIFFQVS